MKKLDAIFIDGPSGVGCSSVWQSILFDYRNEGDVQFLGVKLDKTNKNSHLECLNKIDPNGTIIVDGGLGSLLSSVKAGEDYSSMFHEEIAKYEDLRNKNAVHIILLPSNEETCLKRLNKINELGVDRRIPDREELIKEVIFYYKFSTSTVAKNLICINIYVEDKSILNVKSAIYQSLKEMGYSVPEKHLEKIFF